MTGGDTARLYHRVTSYAREREFGTPVDDARVLQDFVINDLDRVPAPCKAYSTGLPTLALPRDWPLVEAARRPARK